MCTICSFVLKLGMAIFCCEIISVVGTIVINKSCVLMQWEVIFIPIFCQSYPKLFKYV